MFCKPCFLCGRNTDPGLSRWCPHQILCYRKPRVKFSSLQQPLIAARLIICDERCVSFCDNLILLFPLQTFKLFEKVAEQDRERQLSALQKREESRCVPPALQELEVIAEPPEGTEELSVAAAEQAGGSAVDAGDVSTPAASGATASLQPDSSSSSSSGTSQLSQGDQAAAAGTNSAEE